MEYYRLVLDFGHVEVGEEFEALFEKVSDAIQAVLDPHPEGEPCVREWFIRGTSVTAEYDLYKEMVTEEYVGHFKEKLKNLDSVDEFLQDPGE